MGTPFDWKPSLGIDGSIVCQKRRRQEELRRQELRTLQLSYKIRKFNVFGRTQGELDKTRGATKIVDFYESYILL